MVNALCRKWRMKMWLCPVTLNLRSFEIKMHREIYVHLTWGEEGGIHRRRWWPMFSDTPPFFPSLFPHFILIILLNAVILLSSHLSLWSFSLYRHTHTHTVYTHTCICISSLHMLQSAIRPLEMDQSRRSNDGMQGGGVKREGESEQWNCRGDREEE